MTRRFNYASLEKPALKEEYVLYVSKDEITFAGAVHEYFNVDDGYGRNIGFSWDWKAKGTRKDYFKHYNQRILKIINKLFAGLKTLSSFTEQEFDAVIAELLSHFPQIKEDSTVTHYKHLIKTVVKFASQQGHNTIQMLWNERVLTKEEVEESRNYSLLKSLTPKEDLMILKALTNSAKTRRGELFGILLMHMLGLRNNEAAGASFGDIRRMETDRSCHTLQITKSTKINSNNLQASGKTWNAVRELPLPDFLYKFLMERRSFVEQQLRAAGKKERVSKCPIACSGNNYTKRCTANELTRAGKRVLLDCKITNAELNKLDSETKQMTSIGDAEPDAKGNIGTAYLFRRSFATHLRLLGMPESMRKYFIGHNTDDNLDTRNSYANDDKLLHVKSFFDRHPICVLFKEGIAWEEKTASDIMDKRELDLGELNISLQTAAAAITIKGMKEGGRLILTADELQATSKTKVTFTALNNQPVRVDSFLSASSRRVNRQVDTTNKTLAVYLNTFNEIAQQGKITKP